LGLEGLLVDEDVILGESENREDESEFFDSLAHIESSARAHQLAELSVSNVGPLNLVHLNPPEDPPES